MSGITRYLPIGLAVAGLLAAGAVQMSLGVRSGDPVAAAGVQAKLDAVPFAVGGWIGTAKAFDEKMIQQARAVAYSSRSYSRGPDRVEVLILAGDPGDMGAHDPERCYGGIGYGSTGNRRAVAGGTGDGFWAETFRTEAYPPASLRVCWTWSDGGPWRAAEAARLDFAGRPVLFKLYATRRVTPRDADRDPAAEFLAAFLPEARRCLGGTPDE